ncbi:MAG: branched-chain amino acid ABC transporter substrate-binding protein [Solirubrobacterales bacterium]
MLTLALLLGALAALAACGDEDEGSDGDFAGLPIETCDEVDYGGEGDRQALIVSDLPMQGDSAERSAQQVEAIRLALEQREWRAGELAVGFQACDDSSAETGLWDEEICRTNAEAYAADERVLGVIGTYNSGCAAVEIPILSEARLAMISPGNTAVCLTEASRSCEDFDPSTLYADGGRNYARVVPNDAFQGAALAEFARDQGIESPLVLYAADDPTSTGQAANFRGAAEQLGTELACYETWDPEANGYAELFDRARRSGADGVVLAGLTEQNGAKLIADKVEGLGANEKVPLLAFDGFTQQATIDEAGDDSSGMFASITGRAPEALSGAGAEFVAELEERVGGEPMELYAPYAGEAAEVLLDAIATAGDDREAVIEAVFATERDDGILGSYEIGPHGDPSVGPVTIFEAAATFERSDEVVPSPTVVRAAER